MGRGWGVSLGGWDGREAGGGVRVREEERQPMQTGRGDLGGFLGMSLESAQKGGESGRNRCRNVL